MKLWKCPLNGCAAGPLVKAKQGEIQSGIGTKGLAGRIRELYSTEDVMYCINFDYKCYTCKKTFRYHTTTL